MKVQVALLVALLAVQASAHGKGGGGFGGGGKKGGGGGYLGEPWIAHQSVVEYQPVHVKKPVLTYEEHVEHQPIVVQKPIKIYPAPPPKLVHKPVHYTVQEWQLVDVPKVTYQPVYVQPIPRIPGGKKGGGLFGGGDKKGGGGFGGFGGLW